MEAVRTTGIAEALRTHVSTAARVAAVEPRQASAEYRSGLGGFVAAIKGTCASLKLIKNVL